MVNYANGKIYFLWSDQSAMFYIGSTTETLSQRLSRHMRAIKAEKNLTSKKMQEHTNIKIELLENYPSSSKDELLAREGHFIRLHRAKLLNMTIPGRTVNEWYEDNIDEIREKKRAYYYANYEKLNAKKQEQRVLHRDKINANNRLYWANNSDAINTKRRMNYEENKDVINKKRTSYREKHREEITDYNRVYRTANRDRINARKRAYYAAKKAQQNS